MSKKEKDKVPAEVKHFEAHAKAIVDATKDAAKKSIPQLQAVLLAAADTNNDKEALDALGKAVKAAFIAAKCPEKTARVYASEAKSIAAAYWTTTTFQIDGIKKPIQMTGGEYFSNYAPGYNTAKQMAIKIRKAGVNGIIQRSSGKKGRKAKAFVQDVPKTKGDWIDVLDKITNAFRVMQGITPETIDYLLAARKQAMGDGRGAAKMATFRRMKDLAAATQQIAEARKANHKEHLASKRAKAKDTVSRVTSFRTIQ